MAFSTSPSSLSSLFFIPKWSYDVFLSFRGEDTRNTFVAHLYSALKHQGIHTYIDEKDLERGETISPTLLKAIEESMISIIVLSSNYASSSWCLEELTKILECKKTKQQIVLPVFYHVDPSEVRNQRGSFGKALAEHQKRFKKDPKVQSWKKALQEVASLAGEHLEDRNENEFMEKIIQWVASKIVESTYQLDIVEYPIGLESRLKDLNTKLEIGRNDITLIIGIYGTSGIGKTTIAKAVFNSIGKEFEARCFLANVRESSSREEGMVKLQKQLIDDLLGNFGSFNIGNVGATNVIKHRLPSKRVLLILDDVDESRQLEELARNKYWFGSGSRIVITTRDQHVLTYHPVDSTYEVQGLDKNQAIQLFSWHAFKRDRPVESYVELTKCIIGYAKGLPLALTVLGSDLRGRSTEQWESALEKYERSPHEGIYKILKISYDGLDDDEKNIFLDIACFFKGKSLEYVTKILDSCHFSASFGIPRLKEKCLITYNEKDTFPTNQRVEMHDLLQAMGKEIVRQESPEAGKRSRLWSHEDVHHVLEENTGTKKIEAMLLNIPEGHDHMIRLHPKAFKKMRNLRLFINENAQFSAVPNYLSNQIRLLDWNHYPSSSLPSNFRGHNLVVFRMPNSLIKELGDQNLKNLTDMGLRNCEFITKSPDLSSSPNLKNLDLSGCKNLVEVHHSVGLLDKLSRFWLTGCSKLRILPKRIKLRSLDDFELDYCSSLEDFPEIECVMEFLDELNLSGTSIKELPSSIENLKGLEDIFTYDCSIIELPSSIVNLPRLKLLNAEGRIDQLGSVRIVKVDGYSQPIINIGKVEEEDGIQSTSSIVSTGEYEIASTTPTNSSIFNDAGSSSSATWKSLKNLYLKYCCLSESNFFTYVNYFPALVSLDLSGSDIVIFPPHQGVRFPELRDLYLNECTELKEILPLPSSIRNVYARGCTSLESFALPSEILKDNGRDFYFSLNIDLYGCHKLLEIISWEEVLQSWAYPRFDQQRSISIILPGMRIPSWFTYRMEAHDSNLCEVDINPPHHWNCIDEILVINVVFGFRSVGIIEPRMMNQSTIHVQFHDGSDWRMLKDQQLVGYNLTDYNWTDFSDHLWMHGIINYRKQVDVSRFRFECESELVVFKSVGIHFLKKHEENVRDDIGDHIELGYSFSYSSSDEKGDRCLDLMDEKKPDSSTMGITITELENEDEHPKEDMDLELKTWLPFCLPFFGIGE